MEQIDSFGSRAARAAKVALLSLSLRFFLAKTRIFLLETRPSLGDIVRSTR